MMGVEQDELITILKKQNIAIENIREYTLSVRRTIIKRSLFCCLLLCLLGLALFPKAIVLKCIAWQASRYCQEAFGAKLVFDDLLWEEGGIIFKGGKLQKGGEMEASFEQAVLLPVFDLKRRVFGGNLNLQALQIVHRKKELQYASHTSSTSFKLFTLCL